MKKNGASILAGYGIPTVALTMYCDISFRWRWILLAYILCLALHGIMCYVGIRNRASLWVVLGNFAGFAANYALWLHCQTPHWNAYFKWLPSSGRMFSLLFASFGVQMWFVFRDYANRKWTKK